MFNKKPKIYIARSMTGRDQAEVVLEAKMDKEFFEACGITVLCPVLKEKVKPVHKILQSDKKHMNVYWPADKRMIRECNVLVNRSPHTASQGVIREHGLQRYGYWKPVVSIYPEGQMPPDSAVPFYEDDVVTDSRVMAVEYILRVHGTYWKRLKWRFKMYRRSFLKDCILKLRFWFQ